jgi:hypothetical protein
LQLFIGYASFYEVSSLDVVDKDTEWKMKGVFLPWFVGGKPPHKATATVKAYSFI